MKKKNIYTLIIILISLITLVFVYNDDYIYKTDIMKIKEITTEKINISENSLGLKEKNYHKLIKGIITNGKNKGQIKIIKYEESYSSVITDRYKKNDKVFIKNNNIEGLKRDVYVTFVITLFITFIFIVGDNKGLLSVLSVFLNIIIFYVGLSLYFKGINILFLCIIESILFTIISMIISEGLNKKTISAIISVMSSIIIMLFMLLLIIKTTNYKGINFNELSFLTVPVTDIILPELLIGSLGAIMDIAITISSSISELINKNKKITVKALNKSSKQIGKDVMSTMTNVLFFTYLCSGLPIFVLAVRNGFTIYNYITTNFSLELTRFLVGSIGIIITIPITTFITIKVFKRGAK